MPKKKLPKEIKDLLNSQIEVEGFDYAMTEKLGPDDWETGMPYEINSAWKQYLVVRQNLKNILKEYGIDPQ